MNSPISFPPPAPALKLVRPSAEKWAATLAEERRRLQEDHEALRAREENLREYESRLRALQAELEAGRAAAAIATPANAAPTRMTPSPFHRPSSGAPFGDEAAIHAAWEKLHRARELFEAEQTHMREDRILIHDKMEMIKRRETELAEREARLAEREALVTAAMPLPEPAANPEDNEAPESTMSKITSAPFKIFRKKKE